jgi:hypothetical protein
VLRHGRDEPRRRGRPGMRHSFRPADILWRAAAGSLQRERHADGIGILEPALELDDVLPVVAEVIQVAMVFAPVSLTMS